uniref:ARAD1B00726p n=1 Tax=Blastobotrys adeninivorans TaxID=409370 RepID=A0A060TAJ0_BLAAD
MSGERVRLIKLGVILTVPLVLTRSHLVTLCIMSSLTTWLFNPKPSAEQSARQRAEEKALARRTKSDQLAKLRKERAVVKSKVDKEHKYANYYSENQTRLMMIDRQIQRLEQAIQELR